MNWEESVIGLMESKKNKPKIKPKIKVSNLLNTMRLVYFSPSENQKQNDLFGHGLSFTNLKKININE